MFLRFSRSAFAAPVAASSARAAAFAPRFYAAAAHSSLKSRLAELIPEKQVCAFLCSSDLPSSLLY